MNEQSAKETPLTRVTRPPQTTDGASASAETWLKRMFASVAALMSLPTPTWIASAASRMETRSNEMSEMSTPFGPGLP